MNTRGSAAALLAYLLLALAMVQVPGAGALSASALVALIFAPVLIVGEANGRVARVAALIAVVGTCGWGLLMAWVAAAGGSTVGDTRERLEIVGWFVGALFAAMAVWWGLRQVPQVSAALAIAAGACITAVITAGNTTEPWKFALATPVTLIALALAIRINRGSVGAVLVASALVSAVLDARSQILFALVAFGALVLPARYKRVATRYPRRSALIAVGAVWIVGGALISAMTNGVFGEQIASRTLRQEGAGNLLFGARTEWGATLTLAAHNPFGYGMGVKVDPTLQTEAVARAGSFGADTAGTYFALNVFTGRVDLHSNLVNLWFHFGIPGLVLGASAALLIGWAILRIALRSVDLYDIFYIYVMTVGLWHLLFSPSGNMPYVAVALGVSAFKLSEQSRSQKISNTQPLAQQHGGAR